MEPAGLGDGQDIKVAFVVGVAQSHRAGSEHAPQIWHRLEPMGCLQKLFPLLRGYFFPFNAGIVKTFLINKKIKPVSCLDRSELDQYLKRLVYLPQSN